MTPTHVLQFLEYVRQKRGKNDARTTKFGVRASVGGRRREVAGRTVGRGKKWRGKGQRTRQGRRAKVAGRSRRGRRGKVVGGPRPGSKGEGQREAEEGRGAKVPAGVEGSCRAGVKGRRSEGADFCKFAGTVNRYGGTCGCLVEAFGNSRGFDRQAFFRRHLAFRRPGEFYGCLLCRSIEGVEV